MQKNYIIGGGDAPRSTYTDTPIHLKQLFNILKKKLKKWNQVFDWNLIGKKKCEIKPLRGLVILRLISFFSIKRERISLLLYNSVFVPIF